MGAPSAFAAGDPTHGDMAEVELSGMQSAASFEFMKQVSNHMHFKLIQLVHIMVNGPYHTGHWVSTIYLIVDAAC